MNWLNKLICEIFGHTTYNQSHRYRLDGKKNKEPYYIEICYRCGEQWRHKLKC